MLQRLLTVLLISMIGTVASSQDRRPSHCIAIADAAPGLQYLHLASLSTPPEDEFTVRISYIDHSMFLIQSASGLDVITDYNGFIGATRIVPDVVTMNNAHGSHWTPFPDRRIPNLLVGWKTGGVPAEHYIELEDVLIRNVTTDIRSRDGAFRIKDGNSIFVFEVAGLCIGHLGHLHHEPSDQQYAALGRLDVVMAAVDGGLTVDIPTMTRIVNRLKSSIVIPMHWFSDFSLVRFLDAVDDTFAVQRDGSRTIEVSLRTLPDRPTVLVLEPGFLTLDDE